MSSDDRLLRMSEQVAEIHGILKGPTGVVAQTAQNTKDIVELKGFRSRVTGIACGVSAAVSILGVKIGSMLMGGNTK